MLRLQCSNLVFQDLSDTEHFPGCLSVHSLQSTASSITHHRDEVITPKEEGGGDEYVGGYGWQ